MESADAPAPYRAGQWLPSDHAFLARWLEAMIHRTHAEPRPLHPAIADFRDLIESDAAIFMLFNQMFEQSRGGRRTTRIRPASPRCGTISTCCSCSTRS